MIISKFKPTLGKKIDKIKPLNITQTFGKRLKRHLAYAKKVSIQIVE